MTLELIGVVAVFHAVLEADVELVLRAIVMPPVSPEHIGDVDVLESSQRGLPLLFHGEMLDVVLEHVVLRLNCRELGYKARVARGIEDDVADSKESEARGSREE